MTRRRAALATPATLISQQTAWTLKMLQDGGSLLGVPKGLNAKGPTPWVYTARSRDERESVDVPTKTIVSLTHAGILAGRAINDPIAGPLMTFTLTARGEQELARMEAAGTLSAAKTPTRGAR